MQYKDIADLPEDERIGVIGASVINNPGKSIAFITDSDPGKKERYIKKLTDRFPQIEVEDTVEGPVPGTVVVRVRKK